MREKEKRTLLLRVSVGYDSLHMKLDGKFSYLKENQRTLSFNVDIVKLPKHKTVFAGSSSEYKNLTHVPELFLL